MSRIALVTGGTSGVGAATAEALARRQWTVVIVGRNQARCDATVGRIQRATGNADVGYVLGDLSSQREVRAVAQEFRIRYGALHVLVNNVGAVFMRRGESVDGIERTLALNHLAPFLLTNLLIDLAQRSEPARIVNVSSVGHTLSKGIRKDDLQWRRGWYRGFLVYHQSKLANLLFTYELARRLAGTRVTVNAVHPGLVATNIGMDNPWYWRMAISATGRLFRSRFIDATEGAKTAVYLASSPAVEGVSGAYFVDEAPVPSSPASRDADTARWLWRVSEKLTGLR
jgi:retinol dehydrogenase-14